MNNLKIKSIYILIIFVFAGCSRFTIVQKPISFSPERVELTKEYIFSRYNINASNITIEPKFIVLHWTAIDSFDSSFAVFNREKLEDTRPDLQSAGQVNVSIHYLVDRDGSVYQLMPDNIMARHVIGLNYSSIGIENVGGENNIDNLTDDQVEANIELVIYLKEKYPSIDYLIGHHEYREFENHPFWLEQDSTYRTKKYDPGERFMNAVRNGTGELNLLVPKAFFLD